MAIRIPHSDNQGGWQPLPAGTYDFTISKVEQTVSSAGNPQLKLSMEVLGPTHAGKKAVNWYSLTPKAAWAVEQLFEALGIEQVDTGEVDEEGRPIFSYEEQDLVGRAVQYNVTIDSSYNPSKPQNRYANPAISEYDPFYAEVKGQPAVPAQPSTMGQQPAQAAQASAPPRLARRPRPPKQA